MFAQGFTVALVGWQFDLKEGTGLSLRVPAADVSGVVRANEPLAPGRLYEVTYRAHGAPVAGLGLAAVRDFGAYLKRGGGAAGETLREHPETLRTLPGYGYSQSARFLRTFLYEGFNADEGGRPVFDGLLVSAAGAGRGEFNCRFAVPGVAGNSVGSVLRVVDLFPFADADQGGPATGRRDGPLTRTRRQRALPKIFYTYSSSEYWARVGSLAHTRPDGNDRGGIRLPHVAVPLAAYPGWNYLLPRADSLGVLGGLYGSFFPLAGTAAQRAARPGDPRPSAQERYGTRENYLAQVRAADPLVAQRLLRPEDLPAVAEESGRLWDYVLTQP